MPPPSTDDADLPFSRFESVCEHCSTSFRGEVEQCPRCGSEPPEAGWLPVEESGDLWLGRSIGGRYRLRSRVGRGASGVVYRATRRHLDQKFAIKVIDLANERLREEGIEPLERVEREVRVLSTISSPHVVGFHDFFELDDRMLAVVMDFVEGRTLERVVEANGQLEADRAMQIALEVAAGLRHAHRRGLVHRDLKPENVMLRALGGGRELAEVIDFGIVAEAGVEPRTSGFVGTPRYTSPEQARNETPDRRTDVYTLGAVLFYMLTGQPPFRQRNPRAVLVAHTSEAAPSPSAETPDNEVPRELEQLVVSMMAKSRDDRPDTMAEVIERIQTIRSSGEDEAERPKKVAKTLPAEALEEGQKPLAPDRTAAGSVAGAADPTSTAIGGWRVTEASPPAPEPGGAEPRPGVAGDWMPAMATDGSGRFIAVGYPTGDLHYSADGGETYSRLEAGEPVTAIDIAGGELGIAVGRASGTTEIYYPSNSKIDASVVIDHESAPRQIAFSSDGYLVAVELGDGGVRLYSTVEGRRIGEEVHTDIESFRAFQ